MSLWAVLTRVRVYIGMDIEIKAKKLKSHARRRRDASRAATVVAKVKKSSRSDKKEDAEIERIHLKEEEEKENWASLLRLLAREDAEIQESRRKELLVNDKLLEEFLVQERSAGGLQSPDASYSPQSVAHSRGSRGQCEGSCSCCGKGRVVYHEEVERPSKYDNSYLYTSDNDSEVDDWLVEQYDRQDHDEYYELYDEYGNG
jgi:hypothetical protein